MSSPTRDCSSCSVFPATQWPGHGHGSPCILRVLQVCAVSGRWEHVASIGMGMRTSGCRVALAAASACLLAVFPLRAAGPGGLLYPPGYEDVVELWVSSSAENQAVAERLDREEWATVIIPRSRARSITLVGDRPELVELALDEMRNGRFGACIPVYRAGVGALIFINDVKVRDLKPGRAALQRDDPDYVDAVKTVTLGAILAHEATHAAQFLEGRIDPRPGEIPFLAHDQSDELEAYLNIDAVYETHLGMSVSPEEYEAIVRRDYANLPAGPLDAGEGAQDFIQQRRLADRRRGHTRPWSYGEAIRRLKGGNASRFPGRTLGARRTTGGLL